MKKSLFIFAAFLMAGMGQLFAQDVNRIGGQLIYGTDINSLGIGAIAEFPVAKRMVISPSFSFYFPKEVGFVKKSAFELNGNLNYTIQDANNILFYAIAGLNYTNWKVKSDMSFIGGPSDFSSSVGRIGLNLGAGANFDIGKNFLPFGEVKYIVGDLDRLVLAAGLKFNF